MTKIAKALKEKVMEQILNGDCERSYENYVETHIYLWDNGCWETTCVNEYGSRFGGMKSGQVELTKEEIKYINSMPWKHVAIEY